MNNLCKLIVLVFFSLLSCTSGTEQFYNSVISKYRHCINGKNKIVVVPGTGCAGCITGVEYFIDENYSKYSDVVFVFTNIQSVKLMKQKMGKVQFWEADNIILDSENDFYNTDNKNKIYPVVIDLYKHKIRGINYISPSQKYSIEELLKNE